MKETFLVTAPVQSVDLDYFPLGKNEYLVCS